MEPKFYIESRHLRRTRLLSLLRDRIRNSVGRGFTVLELLVSMAVIGVMIALVLPAIQAARESARRTECTNSLRQIGFAIQSHHETYGRFPAGWATVPDSGTAFGWAPKLLPYLDQHALHSTINERAGVDQPVNDSARNAKLEVFLCASDIQEPFFQLFREVGDHESNGQESDEVLLELPAANYVGVFGTTDPDECETGMGEGVFVKDHQFSFAQLLQGATHTLFVGERTARKLPSTWMGIHLEGEDAAGRLTGQAWLGPNRMDADECEFDSRHPGGVNFLFGDAHATWMSDDIDVAIYRRMASRAE